MSEDAIGDLVEAIGLGNAPFWPGAGETSRAIVYSRWDHLFPKVRHSALEFYATLEATLAAKKMPETTMGRVTWKERGLFSSRREYLRIRRLRYTYDICAAPFGEDYFFSAWLVVGVPRLTRYHWLGIATTLATLRGVEVYGGWWGLAEAAAVLALVFWAVRTERLADFMAKRIPLEEFCLGLTIVLAIYDRFFRRLTYFEEDTAAMFQQSVLGAMQETIDGLSQAKGVRLLTPDERKPIVFGFHHRGFQRR